MEKKLRGNTVFARVNSKGELFSLKDGRVEVVYKKVPGAKVYRASARNLEAGGSDEIFELDMTPPVAPESESGDGTAEASEAAGDAIIIYTDGGARPTNPGPMGIGVVVLDGEARNEISEFLGHGTNNIAELTAIMRALQSLDAKSKKREIRIHTDSNYALGLLTKGWKAKKNQELVAELRAYAGEFPRLRMIKVKAHVGIPENERADELATEAAVRGR